jgi:hypothetical protein
MKICKMAVPVVAQEADKTPPRAVEAGAPPVDIWKNLATPLVALWEPGELMRGLERGKEPPCPCPCPCLYYTHATNASTDINMKRTCSLS